MKAQVATRNSDTAFFGSRNTQSPRRRRGLFLKCSKWVSSIPITIFYFIVLLLLIVKSVYAVELPNNKFGIHLAQPHLADLQKAAELVNGGGGDWGYVTLVMQENDRDRSKWQDIFDRLRELHLIPIIRLATQPQGENWRRPEASDADSWANFLDRLNWVVKNRYVILFNEPNHGSEWGGEVDAKSYAEVAAAFAQKLKAKNPDFFIMLAGLDASAPSFMPGMESEDVFLKEFIEESRNLASSISNNTAIQQCNNLFDCIDGWASHSYPNPGFAGSPNDTGRGTIRTYQWELELLQQLGITKKLPVFITETGWMRTDDHPDNVLGDYFQTAYKNVWLPDDNVIAVTPFVLDYQGPPFLEFSWKKYNSDEFFSQYYAVQAMAKTKGQPEQVDRGQIQVEFPRELVSSSSYHFHVTIRNTGQAIWDKDNGYSLQLENFSHGSYFFSDLKKVVPMEDTDIDLYLKTNSNMGKNKIRIVIMKGNTKIAESGEWLFDIVPLPSLQFDVHLYPKLVAKGNDFEIQIFDANEELVFKRGGIKVAGDNGTVDEIQNIVPGKKYRVVILKPYYLPRQEYTVFQKGVNSVRFKPMLPLDFDRNGHLDSGDLDALIKNPGLIRLLFP